MVMSKRLYGFCVLTSVMLMVAVSMPAQELPVLNTFSNRTFTGTVDVSWPVLFDNCTFRTDGTVLKHSYGAVFRNCRIEGAGGNLYIAESGDGIILADCEVTGCDEMVLCRQYNPANRNYIAGITVNGQECSVLEEQETVIDIEGLAMAESARGGSDGPLFMVMSPELEKPGSGELAHLHVRGLEKGMFVGWRSSDESLRLAVDDDGLGCRVYAPDDRKIEGAVISAYTEYGLEAAFEINSR